MYQKRRKNGDKGRENQGKNWKREKKTFLKSRKNLKIWMNPEENCSNVRKKYLRQRKKAKKREVN